MEIPDMNTLAGTFNILDFLLRLGINFFIMLGLVLLVYYPRHRNKDFVFTFLLFNMVNFLICYMLSSLTLKMGFAFGLFAIFSIIRYRTVTVPIREMGYFFLCVALGIINALGPVTDNALILIITNVFLLALTLVLDRFLSLDHENFKQIKYERIDLITPEKRTEMIADLKQRTGLEIHKVEIIRIDFLRDVALVHAFYFSKNNDSSSFHSESGDDL